ncbi:MAG: AlpA family phage regulatory protein [Pseudomonadota bacterium]
MSTKSQHPDIGRVLSYSQAARYLSASRSSLYTMVAENPEFPRPVRLVGRRVGFLIEELDAWLDSQAAARGDR